LQLAPGICWALVSAQPFAEQQVRTRQVGCRGGAAENVDGLLVEFAGLIGRGHQRRGPGEQPEGPAGSAVAESISGSHTAFIANPVRAASFITKALAG
jgi:hypothetical protein